MTDSTPPDRGHRTAGRPLRTAALLLAGSLAGLLTGLGLAAPALAQADVFQQAVNYVFTGRVDAKDGPQIVDRQACVVTMRDPKFNRTIRYYLQRFNMDAALFDKKYAGSKVIYQLDVKGDDDVIEYLAPDGKTVTQGYRSAQIALPGDIDQTQKALKIIFSQYCKTETPKSPF